MNVSDVAVAAEAADNQKTYGVRPRLRGEDVDLDGARTKIDVLASELVTIISMSPCGCYHNSAGLRPRSEDQPRSARDCSGCNARY